MTAEIAVMNKLAVALAADSAVTISDRRREKVYDTVNKLFALSKHHPVGVMVYGASEFMNVPWEVVIKRYRAQLGSKSFPTLGEHAQSFLDFLAADEGIANPEREEASALAAVRSFFALIKNSIDERVKEELAKTGAATDERVVQITAEMIRLALEHLEGLALLPHLPAGFGERALALYGEQVDRLITEVFARLPIADDLRGRLRTDGVSALGRDYFSPAAGLVVAGYGDDEVFPHLAEFIIEARFAGYLKYRVNQEMAIGHNNAAVLVPFAQSEMVHSFMRGIEPDLDRFVHSYVKGLLRDYPDHIAKSLESLTGPEREAFVDSWRQLGSQLADDFEKKMQAYVRKFFSGPVVDVIASLPKDELAAMAETLVNLTSFKRKVTMATETVGGPIDVAVISKGDGLVWIKRKHYFEAGLNPGFFANYYRGSGERHEPS